jgi:hypothetical protein
MAKEKAASCETAFLSFEKFKVLALFVVFLSNFFACFLINVFH